MMSPGGTGGVARPPAVASLYRRLLERGFGGSVRRAGTPEEHLEVRGAANVVESAAFTQGLLRHGGFSTFYYPAHASWASDGLPAAPDGEPWQSGRESARRGARLTRVVVLERRAQLDDAWLLRLINQDAGAGIETFHVLAEEIPSHYPRDFAVWDDEVYVEACLGRGEGGQELAACRYFQDGKHLSDARELQRGILRVAARCSGLPSEESLLAESVEEQYRTALQWCRGNGGRETCAWYHGSWHLLRACGVVITPAWHRAFFAGSIHSIVSRCLETRPRARILVSGLADYGMLYHLLAGVGPLLLPRCDIDLLDLCEVPLRMCRWLEERLRRSPAQIEVPLRHLHQQDILASALPAGAYDLIVSDAFITRFEQAADKRRVVEEWLRLLAPGGQAVTTIKFCSFFDEFPPSEMWRRRFVERALEKRPPYVPAAELERLAHEYARRVHSFPFPDPARIRAFLSEIPQLEVPRLEVDDDRSGVIGTPFARVVLQRRG